MKIIIAGAGIVGLATAYKLLQKNPKIKLCILEKENGCALHQTGHNSGVIHSGIYYLPNSKKAKTCIAGRKELLAFCQQENIPFKKIGKFIVATKNEEIPILEELYKRGIANQVPNIKIVSKEEYQEKEPHANGVKALWVPECAITHFPTVATVLDRKIRELGGEIYYCKKICSLEESQVITENKSYTYDFFINCAGLHADLLAKKTGAIPSRIIPFRGEYYQLREEKKELVNHLIYPVFNPKLPFLGVHITPMIDGKVKVGPNAVLAFSREGYKWNNFSGKDLWDTLTFPGFWRLIKSYGKTGVQEYYRSLYKKAFVKDVQKMMPCIEEKDLLPGPSGVRAQLVNSDGKLEYDFAFTKEKNMLHILNAPSPAATASFAIADLICEQVL